MKPKQSSVQEEYINSENITNTKQFLFNKRKNGLSAYIKKNSDDDRECTHRLLDGGNLHISKSELNQFYNVYATDLVSNLKNYMVELRTPVFKYYIDMDIFDHEFYTGKKLQKIIIKIQTALSFFFGRHTFDSDVYVCTTPPKHVFKEEQEYIKTGVHLIWPHVLVTQEIALFLRQFIIQYLIIKIGERPEHNDWGDVIDETVYIQNGLRMIGSYKAFPCKICKNKEPALDSCDFCFGQGRLYGKHTYRLEYILSTNKTIKKKKFAEIIRKQSELTQLLSIRSYKFKSNINIEEPFPTWFNVMSASKTNKRVYNVLKKTREHQKRTGGSNAINIDDKGVYDTVETLIKNTFGAKTHFQNIGIKSIRKPSTGKKECYWVTTDCSYCLNVNRCHNSSTIYFRITYSRITQKCFSKKSAMHDRKVMCSAFESDGYDISLSDKKILFPESYNEETNNNPMMQASTFKTDNTKMTKDQTITTFFDFDNKLNTFDLFS